MGRLKLGFLIIMTCLFASKSYAQRATDLVINEVMTVNENNYMDPFGAKVAWVEIYNDSEGTVDIAGCYLTDDKNNLKKYPFVKGDRKMKIGPHQRILVFCNSETAHSVLHTNFTLKPGQQNYIALVSANGLDIIDEVEVPVLEADKSWGAQRDGEKETRSFLEKATPNAANYVYMGDGAVAVFKARDPFGIGMALTAMSVVFCALACLFLSFKLIGFIAVKLTNARARKASGMPKGTKVDTVSGEIFAAISMAIHLNEDSQHDEEDTILTIRHIEKKYSPWSSKIYGLREVPEKRK